MQNSPIDKTYPDTERKIGTPERIAIKRLTLSDLTFFNFHYQREGISAKQSGINLNTQVFIKEFFGGLRGERRIINTSTTIYGPDNFGAFRPAPGTRAITYNNGKN